MIFEVSTAVLLKVNSVRMYSCVVRTEQVDREEFIDWINVCLSVCY